MSQLILTQSLVPLEGADPLESIRIASELSHAMQEEARLRAEHKETETGMNKVSDSFRPLFPGPLADLNMVEQEIQIIQSEIQELLFAQNKPEVEEDTADDDEEFIEDFTHEEKKTQKARKKAVREIYGKISNLCHPDKTLKLDPELRDRLHAIFIEAKEAYENVQFEYMLELHVEAVLTRSGKTEEQVKEDKKEKLEMLYGSIQRLEAQLAHLRQHPIYVVYDLHQNGHINQAKGVYRQILGGLQHQKDMELSQLKRQLHSMKENNTWSIF